MRYVNGFMVALIGGAVALFGVSVGVRVIVEHPEWRCLAPWGIIIAIYVGVGITQTAIAALNYYDEQDDPQKYETKEPK